MNAFTVPEFYMPFEARVNPHLDGCRERVPVWAEAMGLLDPEYAEASDGRWSRAHFERADFPLFAAYAYPDAHAAELDLLCSWYVMLWFFDDQLQAAYERDPATLTAGLDRILLFMPVHLQPLPLAENAAERAAADLWTRTAPVVSVHWRERFRHAFRSFGEGHRWFERMIGRENDLLDFVELRREEGGGGMMTCLLEHDRATEIPRVVYESRPYRVLVNTFIDALDLQNDIVSYNREHALGEGAFNGVTVFQRMLDCSLQEAVDTVNRVCTARIHTMQSAVNVDLPTVLDERDVDPATRRRVLDYARACQTMVAGCYAWALESSRYRLSPARRVPSGPTGLGTSAAQLPAQLARR